MAIEKIRYTAGTDINVKKNHTFNIFYRYQNMKNVEDGDYDRAMRYMAFCRSCNSTFNPHLRAYQLKSIIHVIEKDGEAAHERIDQILIVAGIVIVLLLLALIIVIVRKRKRNQA